MGMIFNKDGGDGGGRGGGGMCVFGEDQKWIIVAQIVIPNENRVQDWEYIS